MRALVCGGAGYIGSHMCRALRLAGAEVFVVDDLSSGHRDAIGDAGLALVSVLDELQLDSVISSWRPDIVFHFAALSVVRDSVAEPLAYYQANVAGTLSLLSSMRRFGVDRIVFSSSAAVYGMPASTVVDETDSLMPINPYGSTKLAVERLLSECATAYGLRSVSLRYFNAAGAHPDGGIGESHEPETHLLPNVLKAADSSMTLDIFGADYATPDGTCIRDYVHVCDLADAHLAAAHYMQSHEGAHAFNLGTGQGCSVMQIIQAVRRVTGKDVPYEVRERRLGDPARLVAGNSRARTELGWIPSRSDVDTLVSSAWNWHRNRAY